MKYSLIKTSAAAVAAAIVVGLGAFAFAGWEPALEPIRLQASSAFAPELVAQGAILSAAGSCATCHTAKNGQPLAGGYPIETSFGTIYSTNITPDPVTGIGTWSQEAFQRALRQGIAADGSHLFPAFPYDHFTKLTDDDIGALYAYFMSQQPVVAPAMASTLPFPLNVRALQAGWKLLFFRSGRFQPRPDKEAAWNRGAYLAEGVSHCGACHSPRNSLGAEVSSQAYGGGNLGGRAVPALTRANSSPVPWSQEELFGYLRGSGAQFHGGPGGPMGVLVRNGLSQLPDADIAALAVYFADIGEVAARTDETKAAVARVALADSLDIAAVTDLAARLYMTACASCHYAAPGSANEERPNLSVLSAVNVPDPTDLLRTILKGRGHEMPGFRNSLTDAEIASIAAYLRASRSGAGPWSGLEGKIAVLRAELANPKLGDSKP